MAILNNAQLKKNSVIMKLCNIDTKFLEITMTPIFF
jgi:hypothetical protein